MTHRIRLTPSARRALEQDLPESVAAAAWEFITGPLAREPRRVGKPLLGHLEGRWSARRGTYRVMYRIIDDEVVVIILRIAHRSDVYHGSS